MRIVALEEHYTVPRIVAGISPDAIARRGFPGPDFVWAQTTKRNELADLGDARLADMDASGITVQVLSVAGPGADLVPGQPGIDLARAYNDALAEACARHPDRYRGFAHLPMLAPEAAADELERTVKHLGFHGVLVNGATDGRFLDDPAFDPILARAETLDVPIYLHPGIPTEAVRNAYYDNLPGNFSFTMALSAWGWHADTAIHTLRLVLSGALDRHPGLKIVIGHMGEALPFMLDRIDETTAAQAKDTAPALGAADDPRSGVDHDQRVLHHGPVHGGAAVVRRGPHHVLGRLPVRVERSRPSVPGRAAGLAGGSREDRPRQRGPVAETPRVISNSERAL